MLSVARPTLLAVFTSLRPQGGPVGAMTAAGMEAEYGGRLVSIGHMKERMVLQGTFT